MIFPEKVVKIHPAFGIDSKSEALLKIIKKPAPTDGAYTLTTNDVKALLRMLEKADAQVKWSVENIMNAKTLGYKRLVTTYLMSNPKEVITSQRSFDQGGMKFTGNKFDLAVLSDVGFLAFKTPAGDLVYSRNGTLKINGDGILMNACGYELYPNIKLPIPIAWAEGFKDLIIKKTGEVSILAKDSKPMLLGQIYLYTFSDVQDLSYHAGCNVFALGKVAQKPLELKPGLKLAGDLVQGYIELSAEI
ncbi:flagellar hook basal-body protein [Leptospira santarosai]|uniref:flagellar hook basal-body protein n=1 Tax=Leptospira santarosai TaxID=28183 RepID=UPI000772F993|nr:flagellar hook basal-body protein [Leptospira santarosai]